MIHQTILQIHWIQIISKIVNWSREQVWLKVYYRYLFYGIPCRSLHWFSKLSSTYARIFREVEGLIENNTIITRDGGIFYFQATVKEESNAEYQRGQKLSPPPPPPPKKKNNKTPPVPLALPSLQTPPLPLALSFQDTRTSEQGYHPCDSSRLMLSLRKGSGFENEIYRYSDVLEEKIVTWWKLPSFLD